MKDLFEHNAILGVLHGFNPWWSGRRNPVPELRRPAFEVCRNYLEDASLRRAVLRSGPRRVGKTTILLQLANHVISQGHDPEPLFYVSPVYLLPPVEMSGKKILRGPNKYYLVDAALRNAARCVVRGGTNSDEMGILVETTVRRHLYAYYYRDVPTISYRRDPVTQKEVDIIVHSPRYTFSFEVKYRENP